MKKLFILALAMILPNCASTSAPPKEVFVCDATRTGDSGKFYGVRYLNINGEPAKASTDPAFHEESALNWVLNSRDGDVLAQIEANPWDSSAWNHDGKVGLRVNWSSPLPSGTRIFLNIPNKGLAFEGFPLDGNRVSSGIYTDWRSFKETIEGISSAHVVFTTPGKQEIQRYPVSLETFHTAKVIIEEIKREIDTNAVDFNSSCKKEVFEYIVVT